MEGRVFSNEVIHKELISEKYKNHLQLNIRKAHNPIKKKKSFDPLAVQWENKKIIKKLI